MNTITEKQLYADEIQEVALRSGLEHFVWGEELVQHKLILYAKKIKALSGYADIKDSLEPCGLVVVDAARRGYMRCMPATLNVLNGDVYLTEANFNASWKYLRKSIAAGISNAERQGVPCDIRQPEEVVDLRHLMRENSVPYIGKGGVQYQAKEPNAEARVENRRKQSLLDRPDLNFFYENQGKYYHDKECEDVKHISGALFCGSKEPPQGKEICPKCQRKIYFRKACAPNAKQIPICDRIFRNHNISERQIRHFVFEAGMHFHAIMVNEMVVEGVEDTWIIRETEAHHLQLWHNNYVRTSETERYITDGFHNQGLKGKTLLQLLRYIEGYTWEKHLQGEALKAAADIVELSAVRDDDAALTTESGNRDMEQNTYHKAQKMRVSVEWIKIWIRKLFRTVTSHHNSL